MSPRNSEKLNKHVLAAQTKAVPSDLVRPFWDGPLYTWVSMLVGAFIAFYIQDWLLSDTTNRTYANLFTAVETAMLTGFFVEFYRKHRLFAAIDLVVTRPSIRRFWHRRIKPAFTRLDGHFRKIEGILISLENGGVVSGCSYREQMLIASYLYPDHESRFWATSLDRWTQFLPANEDYIETMLARYDPCSKPSLSNHGADGPREDDPASSPPVRARIFVVLWQQFVDDLIHHDDTARLTVRIHFDAWTAATSKRDQTQPPFKILPFLGDGDTKLAVGMGMDRLGKVPRIPDFMLVDQRFVYGRVLPEVVQSDITQRTEGIDLQLLLESDQLQAYEKLYRNLWKAALDPRVLSYALCEADGQPLSETVEMPTPPPAVLEKIVCWLKDNKSIDELRTKKLVGTLRAIYKDIAAWLEADDRQRRYPQLGKNASPAGTIQHVAYRISNARLSVFAVDQADLKQPSKRFWERWITEAEYQQFDDATKSSNAQKRRRIFVLVRSLDAKERSAPELRKFLTDQISAGVHVGLIENDLLKQLASANHGLQSRARLDSDFIVFDVHSAEGKWSVTDDSGGFEISNKEFHDKNIGWRNCVPAFRVTELADWFHHIWGNCVHVEMQQDVETYIAGSSAAPAPKSTAPTKNPKAKSGKPINKTILPLGPT